MSGHVVITGASRGIGRALAARFAERNTPLVLVARSKPDLEQLQAELVERHRIDVKVVPADLATPEGVAAVEAACQDLSIQGLVNNAGFGTAGPFEQCSRDEERRMIRLNVEALTDLCHAFLPRLKGVSGAFIINVASTASFQPVPLFATYSATKAFVLSLSEALAEELEPLGIHVLALCPGATETGFQRVANVKAVDAVNADDVARYALEALDRRQRVAVHGALNAFLAFSGRFAPRKLVAKMAKKKMEPWFEGR